MNDTTRTILIALGVVLLVIILVPLLFMAGMMGGMMNGNGMMNGGGACVMRGLVLLILVAGMGLLAIGVGRRR